MAKLKFFISIIISVQLAAFPIYAQSVDSGFVRADDVSGLAKGNTFVSGERTSGVLIKVNLWGAVNKSGIHYVPHETDFVSLLSYAGGPKGNANLEDAYIKRKTKDSEEIIPVNIRDLVGSNSSHNPSIYPNDIIVIPENQPTIDPNTVTTIAFISSVMSVLLAGFLISNNINDD